jgi:hypothetical protein
MGFIPEREVVVVGEVVSLPRLQAAFDGWNPAREDEHDVLAERGQLPDLPAAEAFA